MKKIINTSQSPQAIGPYSQAVLYDRCLYISGQIPLDPTSMQLVKGGIKEQTSRVLDNLKAILADQSLNFSHLLKVSIFLKDLTHFNQVNQIYQGYFIDKNYPARETVMVSRLPKDALIEISAIAHL